MYSENDFRALGIIIVIWVISALIWGLRGFMVSAGITVIIAGVCMIWAGITGNV